MLTHRKTVNRGKSRGNSRPMKVDGRERQLPDMDMPQIVENLDHRRRIKWNGGGSKELLEGLPSRSIRSPVEPLQPPWMRTRVSTGRRKDPLHPRKSAKRPDGATPHWRGEAGRKVDYQERGEQEAKKPREREGLAEPENMSELPRRGSQGGYVPFATLNF